MSSRDITFAVDNVTKVFRIKKSDDLELSKGSGGIPHCEAYHFFTTIWTFHSALPPINSDFLNSPNWDLFHFLLKKYCIKAPINNPTEEITKYQMECMSAESL